MKKTIAAMLLAIILVVPVAGCSAKIANQTPIIQTKNQVATAVTDYLSALSQSAYAKGVLADFYDTFNECDLHVLTSANAYIEVDQDSDVANTDFTSWEYSVFPSGSLPEIFIQIFNPRSEVGPAGTSEVTVALRWLVDSHTGKVTTTNPNALRLEAELIK